MVRPFAMERWQSVHENRVDYNLSESGVHPLTLDELLALAGESGDGESGDGESGDGEPGDGERAGGASTSDAPAGDASAGVASDLGAVRSQILATSLSYGQSNGSDELRARIASLYPDASDAEVVVTNGSAEANFVALWALVRPGDEVVILTPTYMQTHGLADAFGARIREVPLRERDRWQPDPDEIDAAFTDRTRLVIVTNPNNPTGAVLHDRARDAVIRAADRVGAWILADEVYTGAELDEAETPSFYGEYPRVIATGSLSKAYGLPGLRIGWAVAPEDTAERLWSRTDYTTISPGMLTDRLATLALRPDVRPRLLRRTRAILHAGLRRLEDWFDDVGVFSHRPPDAGAICYARYDLAVESTELVEHLRAEHSVLLVPGRHFGMGRYLRFGYGLLDDDLRAALDRVGDGLAALRARAGG